MCGADRQALQKRRVTPQQRCDQRTVLASVTSASEAIPCGTVQLGCDPAKGSPGAEPQLQGDAKGGSRYSAWHWSGWALSIRVAMVHRETFDRLARANVSAAARKRFHLSVFREDELIGMVRKASRRR